MNEEQQRTLQKLGLSRIPDIGKVLQNVDLDTLLEQFAVLSTGYQPDPVRELQETTYYDYPALKAPIWKWEIIWYFFFGGLAAGCYVIASVAALFGSKEDRAVVRAGYYISLLALIFCPPLLIKDLGRPERFLNMLRVFKAKSPMSMGVWGLVIFSLFSALSGVIQAAKDGFLGRWWGARLLAALPQRLLAIPGSGFAVFLGSYTGVLLATTSVPLWSRSKLLGGIFISSAMSTSTALISFVLRLVGTPKHVLHKLEQLEWSAMLLEIIGLLAFLRGSGRAARALVGTQPQEHGQNFWRFMFGGGLILPWLLQTIVLLSSKKQTSKPAGKGGAIISLLVLMGGYFLRRTLIDAGHSSSQNAREALWNARR